MIKVIATDMDGTLLNTNHEIHKENIKAINKARELGIKTVISTGREYDMVVDLLSEANLSCDCILLNGAEFRDEKGKIVEKINISKDSVRKIFDILQKKGMRGELFTNNGYYTINSKEEALKGVAEMCLHFEKSINTLEEAIEFAKNHPRFKRLKYIDDYDKFINSSIEIRKIMAFYSDEKVIEEAKKEISQIGGLAVSSSFRDNIEITDEKAQKGLILAKVVDKYGIDKEEVIVLGDSFNDYSMFTEFANSYAMENAIPEIKEIAKYITDTNNNAGVAKAIYKEINDLQQQA